MLPPQSLEPWSSVTAGAAAAAASVGPSRGRKAGSAVDYTVRAKHVFSNILLQARYPRVDAERFLGQEAMAQEIEALGQAKAVLSGADFS